MPLNKNYVRTPTGILKFVEIACVILTFAIFRSGGVTFGSADGDFFASGVLVTAMIVTPLLLICYLMGRIEIQKSILEVSLNALLCLFLMAAGIAGAVFWTNHRGPSRDRSLAMCSFCIIGSAAYLIDTIFSFKNFNS